MISLTKVNRELSCLLFSFSPDLVYYNDHKCPPLVIKRKNGVPIINKHKNKMTV